MKKKILFSLLTISAFCSNNFAQNKIELFPSHLLVQPFTANTLKPKLGFELKTSKNEISLNIGNSIDVLHYKIDDESMLSFGADLYTYTLLRSQSNFHFPVDAVDYLFGFNFGYLKKNFGTRLRISHISAHFVDGHFNKAENKWRDERTPKVYSREFLEVMPFYSFDNFRFYAGLTYIFSIDPTNIGTDQYQIGFEYFGKNILTQKLIPYFAYDLRLLNIYNYTGNNSLEVGIKWGYKSGRGISFYFRYFSGYSIHGEYFDVKEDFTSVGFNLDL